MDIYTEERNKAETVAYGIKVLKEEKLGFPTLRVWKPKALKPLFYYRFKTMEEVNARIEKEIANHKAHLDRIQEYKKSRAVTPEQAHTLQKGDIFFTSWGYDQTNYEYIVVLRVSPSGKTAECQRTSSLHMGTTNSGQSNVQEPIFCPFGDKFQMQIKKGYQGGLCLRGSYPFCCDGTGSRRLGTFSKVSIGEQFHETDAQFGH